MRDVLLIGDVDWANTGFRFSRCLRLLGLDALMIKSAPHPFMYPEQALIHPGFWGGTVDGVPTIAELAEDSKVIHFIGSVFVEGVPIEGKKVVVQHGGSIYREEHKQINEHFNKIADAAIIQCPDLLGLGAKNEHLIYYPVDTDAIQPVFGNRSDKLIIGHFPSNPMVKGTAKIRSIINQLEYAADTKGRFAYVGNSEKVSWATSLKRMAACDVIIETCQSELNGKPYGEWGNTALEAAALGKVVITNMQHKNVYADEYGNIGLEIANDASELEKKLRSYITGEIPLESMQRVTRDWVETNHSMQATAQRLWDKVYKHLC